MRAYDIEVLVVALERAKDAAVRASMDEHFISEIDHLLATARSNREDAQ